MLNQKDIFTKTLRILDEKDVILVENEKEEDNYIFSALTCNGGGVFKKGVSIGMQNKMVPGLIMYDNENFYGFSEKHGLSLLSSHPEYIQIEIPNNVFIEQEVNKLQPIKNGTTDNFQNLKDTEKNKIKILNIDLDIKDSNSFYIIIPNEYNTNKSFINFDISFIYSLNTIISNITLVIINESNKSIFFKIMNKNCFYENEFPNEIQRRKIFRINVEVINNDYFLITKKEFMFS